MLIAVQHFDASELLRSFLAAPTFFGMMMGLFAWKWLSRLKTPLPTLSALLRGTVGIGFILSSLFESPTYYALTIVATCLFMPINLSLQTSLYKENYPAKVRGKMFGWSMVLNLLGSILFHWLIGMYLETDISRYRHVLVLYGTAALVSAFFISRIPAPATNIRNKNQNIRESLKLIFTDKLFGYMLLIWYIFGFSNLVLFPVRVIYLADSKYNLSLPPTTVALLAGILPDVFRVLFTPIWGYLFDRFNFIKLRIVLNTLLWLSIFFFFLSPTPWIIAMGSILHGIFFAGGSLAWMLWVTHYAPPGKTSQYMSVHIFFTGTRGVLGAFIGIYFVEKFGIHPVWIFSLCLCALSIAMLFPVIRQGNFRQRESALPVATRWMLQSGPEKSQGIPRL